MSTTTSPLAQLATTEAALVRQIGAATSALGTVGDSLPDAVADLQAAARAARDRLAAARLQLLASVQCVFEDLTSFAAELSADLAANSLAGEQPLLPAPEPEPSTNGHTEPVVSPDADPAANPAVLPGVAWSRPEPEAPTADNPTDGTPEAFAEASRLPATGEQTAEPAETPTSAGKPARASRRGRNAPRNGQVATAC